MKYNRLTAFKLFAMTSSMVISVDELAPFGKTGATALFYLLIAGIAWFIPKLNGSTLVAFVPFMLAFCGGGASAPHVKNLDHYSKVMLALAITAICFDLLGSMAIGMTVPKDQIQNSTGFVYTYKAGNYVIVGGDFNHALGRDMLTHFDHQEKIPSWVSVLDQKMLPKDFIMVKATNRERVATVRSTDMKYRPKVNYQTVGDGFIISKNIKAKATDINTDYRYADHNPVRLGFSLK